MAQISWSLALLLVSSALLNCQPAHSQVEAASDHEANNDSEKAEAFVEDEEGTSVVFLKYFRESIQNRLYTTDGKHLKPDETYDLLKELVALSESIPREHLSWRECDAIKLVKARDRNPGNCTPEYLEELNSDLELHKRYRRTIVPYLKNAINEFKKMCEEDIRSNLHSRVNETSSEMREDIKTIGEGNLKLKFEGNQLMRDDMSDIWTNYPLVVEGILHVLKKRKYGDLFTRDELINIDKFKKLYNEQIIPLCETWTDITDPIADFWSARLRFDELEAEWLSHGRTCHMVKRYKDFFIGEAYERLEAEYPKLSIARRIQKQVKNLNCFGKDTC